MIVFNFEGKKIEVPTKWNEVTVKHFMNKDFLTGNAIGLLSSLSGIHPVRLANTVEDHTKKFRKVIAFIKKEPLGWRGGSRDEIELMGVTCKIPKDLEVEKFGQKILFGQVLLKNKWHYDSIAEAVAIYLAPQVFPEDWYERIDEVTKEVEKLPIHSVWVMADFFLKTSLKYRRNGAAY